MGVCQSKQAAESATQAPPRHLLSSPTRLDKSPLSRDDRSKQSDCDSPQSLRLDGPQKPSTDGNGQLLTPSSLPDRACWPQVPSAELPAPEPETEAQETSSTPHTNRATAGVSLATPTVRDEEHTFRDSAIVRGTHRRLASQIQLDEVRRAAPMEGFEDICELEPQPMGPQPEAVQTTTQVFMPTDEPHSAAAAPIPPLPLSSPSAPLELREAQPTARRSGGRSARGLKPKSARSARAAVADASLQSSANGAARPDTPALPLSSRTRSPFPSPAPTSRTIRSQSGKIAQHSSSAEEKSAQWVEPCRVFGPTLVWEFHTPSVRPTSLPSSSKLQPLVSPVELPVESAAAALTVEPTLQEDNQQLSGLSVFVDASVSRIPSAGRQRSTTVPDHGITSGSSVPFVAHADLRSRSTSLASDPIAALPAAEPAAATWPAPASARRQEQPVQLETISQPLTNAAPSCSPPSQPQRVLSPSPTRKRSSPLTLSWSSNSTSLSKPAPSSSPSLRDSSPVRVTFSLPSGHARSKTSERRAHSRSRPKGAKWRQRDRVAQRNLALLLPSLSVKEELQQWVDTPSPEPLGLRNAPILNMISIEVMPPSTPMDLSSSATSSPSTFMAVHGSMRDPESESEAVTARGCLSAHSTRPSTARVEFEGATLAPPPRVPLCIPLPLGLAPRILSLNSDEDGSELAAPRRSEPEESTDQIVEQLLSKVDVNSLVASKPQAVVPMEESSSAAAITSQILDLTSAAAAAQPLASAPLELYLPHGPLPPMPPAPASGVNALLAACFRNLELPLQLQAIPRCLRADTPEPGTPLSLAEFVVAQTDFEKGQHQDTTLALMQSGELWANAQPEPWSPPLQNRYVHPQPGRHLMPALDLKTCTGSLMDRAASLASSRHARTPSLQRVPSAVRTARWQLPLSPTAVDSGKKALERVLPLGQPTPPPPPPPLLPTPKDVAPVQPPPIPLPTSRVAPQLQPPQPQPLSRQPQVQRIASVAAPLPLTSTASVAAPAAAPVVEPVAAQPPAPAASASAVTCPTAVSSAQRTQITDSASKPPQLTRAPSRPTHSRAASRVSSALPARPTKPPVRIPPLDLTSVPHFLPLSARSREGLQSSQTEPLGKLFPPTPPRLPDRLLRPLERPKPPPLDLVRILAQAEGSYPPIAPIVSPPTAKNGGAGGGVDAGTRPVLIRASSAASRKVATDALELASVAGQTGRKGVDKVLAVLSRSGSPPRAEDVPSKLVHDLSCHERDLQRFLVKLAALPLTDTPAPTPAQEQLTARQVGPMVRLESLTLFQSTPVGDQAVLDSRVGRIFHALTHGYVSGSASAVESTGNPKPARRVHVQRLDLTDITGEGVLRSLLAALAFVPTQASDPPAAPGPLSTEHLHLRLELEGQPVLRSGQRNLHSLLTRSLGVAGSNLRALLLFRCKLDDTGLSALLAGVRRNSNLSSFSLVDSGLGLMAGGANVLPFLLEHPSLRHVDLSQNELDDTTLLAAADVLHSSGSAVRSIDLSLNACTAAGVTQFAAVLTHQEARHELRALNLEGHLLSSAVDALASLACMPSMRTLNVSYCNLGAVGCASLLQSLRSTCCALASISLAGNLRLPQAQAGNGGGTAVDLTQAQAASKVLEHLIALRSLRQVDLRDNQLREFLVSIPCSRFDTPVPLQPAVDCSLLRALLTLAERATVRASSNGLSAEQNALLAACQRRRMESIKSPSAALDENKPPAAAASATVSMEPLTKQSAPAAQPSARTRAPNSVRAAVSLSRPADAAPAGHRSMIVPPAVHAPSVAAPGPSKARSVSPRVRQTSKAQMSARVEEKTQAPPTASGQVRVSAATVQPVKPAAVAPGSAAELMLARSRHPSAAPAGMASFRSSQSKNAPVRAKPFQSFASSAASGAGNGLSLAINPSLAALSDAQLASMNVSDLFIPNAASGTFPRGIVF